MKKIKTKKLSSVYFENLDALRFIAFLVVFLHHIFSVLYFKPESVWANEFISRCMMNGNLGVNFFFVLSGFLITYLLLKEKESTDTIVINKFYLRRGLRIWPLYFLVLLISFYIIPACGGYKGNPKINHGLYFLFMGNFDLVKHGVGNFLVSVLWSVSIEEQFYLFWPLLLLIVPMKHMVKFLTLVVILSISFRLFAHTGKSMNLMLSYHTLSCIYNLAVGGIIAYLTMNEQAIEKIKKMSRLLIICVYIAGIALIVIQKDILQLQDKDSHYIEAVLPLFYAFFFAFVIMEQVFAERSLFKVGRIPFLTKLGTISYGLYCFHMIVIYIVMNRLTVYKFSTGAPGPLLFASESALAFAMTLLVAWLSYRFIEKPFLRYKSRLSAAE
ncbi:MAG: acyltransferase [Bacteroidetes bacterium]|nr:acyltransferase [Bacteroidota bacterium]